MHIIEQFTESKLSGRDNEDGLVVTPGFAAVIDGSTSKLPADEAPVPSTGRCAMLAVAAAVRTLPREADLPSALHHLTAAVLAAYPDEAARRQALRSAPHRYTCSAAIYSAARREVWLVGDCQCRVGGRTYTHPKAIDALLTEVRCDAVRYLLAHGHTREELLHRDLGRAFILDALREQTYFQNDISTANPFAYPVIDGTSIAPERVAIVPVGEARRLVLASDGYPVLYDTLAETEADLRRRLQRDPLCIDELPATKCWVAGQRSFDDRTYLGLSLI